MMTDKEIEKLRKEVSTYKLRLWVVSFIILLGIASSLFKISMIDRLCKTADVTWTETFSICLKNVDHNEIYKGTQIIAVNYLSEALLLFAVYAFIIPLMFIYSRKMMKRNRLLLQYIDQENDNSAQQAGPGYPPQSVGPPDP
jgi:hypothetical protein